MSERIALNMFQLRGNIRIRSLQEGKELIGHIWFYLHDSPSIYVAITIKENEIIILRGNGGIGETGREKGRRKWCNYILNESLYF